MSRLTPEEIEVQLRALLAEPGPVAAPVFITEADIQRRPLKDPEGMLTNPTTGRKVSSSGRLGKSILRSREKQLAQQGNALPKGSKQLKRSVPVAPGPLTQQGEKKHELPGQGAIPKALRAFGAFRAQEFTAARPITSLREFANTIARVAAATPHYRQAVVGFEDDQGNRINRTLKGLAKNGEPDPDVIVEELESFNYGDSVTGSDTIPAYFRPVVGRFEIGYLEPVRAAGLSFRNMSLGKPRVRPHFTLVELSAKANESDCFLAVARAVAKAHGLEVTRQKNTTIRSQLGIGEGPISMDEETVDKIARFFGLRIRVITGMEAIPDSERSFDDDGNREEGRNLCVLTDVRPVVIAYGGDENSPDCPVYYEDNHCEYISNFLAPLTCKVTGDIISADKPPAKKDIKLRVLEQGRVWYGCKAKTGKKPRKYEDRVIVFDYETTYEPNGLLVPYALGFIELKAEDLSSPDMSPLADRVVQTVRREGQKESEVSAPLLSLIACAPSTVRYTLVSYNGARFDHYILAKAAHARSMLTSVFATRGAGLRVLRLGRHKTLDIAKLLPPMKLMTACTSFDTNPKKLEGFSHYEIQEEHANGRLFTSWLAANLARLTEYLTGDVLSEASLFVILRSSFVQSVGIDIMGEKSPATIGGLAWEAALKKCPIPMAVSDEEIDLNIRKAITGGRVQIFGDEPSVIRGEAARMVDVVSLYPTAMAAVDKVSALFKPSDKWGYYPQIAESAPRKTTCYAPGDVGVYWVRVIRQPEGLPNVLPLRQPGEPLGWKHRGEFETMATHIDISLIREYGGEVEVLWGYKWNHTKHGLFRPFISELARLKNEQDGFKSSKDKQYNPALREVYKALMNSLSGKCCQKNYDDLTIIATGSAAQLSADKKIEPGTSSWIPIGGETVIVTGKKLKDSVYNPKKAKPSILAVLIYSYSRAYVWKTICQHHPEYMDTDSGAMSVKNYEELRRAFPQLDPAGRAKELGDLEEELGENKTSDRYYIAPKEYAIMTDSKSKVRIKGIHDSDRIVVGDPTILEKMSLAELAKEYEGKNGSALTVPFNAREFFERRLKAKVSMLSSQITRGIKDPSATFALRQRFLIKEA